MSDEQTIDTGDFVHHEPSGENWIVAYVQGDRLSWCGWPPGEARVSDCTLIHKCVSAERHKLLLRMAEMTNDDARKRYAVRKLAQSVGPETPNDLGGLV